MISKKIIFLLFLLHNILYSSSSFYFSLDDKASNVKNSLEFYIYMNTPISSSYANVGKIKPLISFKKEDEENTTIQTNVQFDIEIQEDDNSTIKIKPLKILDSNTKYHILFNGSKIKDIYLDIYEDRPLSFTSSEFAKLIISDENISILNGESKTIYLQTDKYVKNTRYEIVHNYPNLTISPNSIFFSKLDWDMPHPIIISTSDSFKYSTFVYDINITNKKGFVHKINITMLDKIDFILEKKLFFSKTKNIDIKIKLSKQPPENIKNISIFLSSDNKQLQIHQPIIDINNSQYNTYKSIKISIASNDYASINAILKISAHNILNIKDVDVVLNFTDPELSSGNLAKIKILDTNGISASFGWGFPEEFSYNNVYTLYVSKNTINYSPKNVAFVSKTNKQLIHLSPNTKYVFSIKAKYEVSILSENNETTTLNKIKTYKPITVITPKILLKDKNKNIILDDIEKVLRLEANNTLRINTEDINRDDIPDILQKYTASIMKSNDYSLFDNYKDSDNDKMPDLLEVSVGRSPKIRDFNGKGIPVISITAKGKNIFLENESSLKDIAYIKVTDNGLNITRLATAYKKLPCFSKNTIPYRIFTNDCKKLLLKDIPIEKEMQLYWVVFDSDQNVAYKAQTIKLFKGKKTISYKVSSYSNYIKSTNINVLFDLGKYAKKTPENNISLKFSKMPNIDDEKKIFKYKNNIFDFRVFRSKGEYVDIILPQIHKITKDNKLKILKNKEWIEFNTEDGDKIFSSKGFNKKCDIDNEYYQEGLKEGSYCIKIRVKDGSLNDSDEIIDGIFSFTGGVGEKIPFIIFETKTSNGCSSLNARGFNNEEKMQNKIDPLTIITWFLSLVLFIKGFFYKKNKKINQI